MIKYVLAFLISTSAFGSQYDDALNAAKDAAYIQTGLASDVDKLGKYMLTKSKNYGQQAGMTDEQLRVSAAGIATSWYVYKHHNITLPINSDSNLKVELYKLTLEHRF